MRLSATDSALAVLRYLLDTKVVLRAVVHGVPVSSGPSPDVVAIAPSRLPLTERDVDSKLQDLFTQCSSKELDILRYCVACFERTLSAPKPSWETDVWAALASGTKRLAVGVALQQVIDGVTAGQDLFSAMYAPEGQAQSSVTLMLERLSGWAGDGVNMPQEMLQSLLTVATATAAGKQAIVELVRAGGSHVKGIKKPDDIVAKAGRTLDGLSVLVSQSETAAILADVLGREVEAAAALAQGDYFEKSSVFSSLLSVTTVIEKLTGYTVLEECHACFTGLRGFPTFSWQDADSCNAQIQEGLHKVHKVLTSALLKILRSPHIRSSAVAWLSALVSLNVQRAGPRFRGNPDSLQGACSDGFMLNVCVVLLELSRPFFAAHPAADKLALIAPGYAAAPTCRLDLAGETCLAQGTLGQEQRPADSHLRFAPPTTPFKFVTECFFATQQALHVGLLPAMNVFGRTLSDLGKQIEAHIANQEKLLKNLHALYLIGWSCSLLDPQFVQQVCQFYITQSVWLVRLMEGCREEGVAEAEVASRQRAVLGLVPESGVKDMCAWFRFVSLIRPTLLQALELTPFVDCCVALLERPDLLPSPLAQGRVVSMLLAFVNSDKRGQAGGLGSQAWGGIHAELSAMVQANPTVRDHLGPALLGTFAAVTVVEGLDVDKEDFDKYAARYEIAQLLRRLWSRPDCRDSILQQCQGRAFRCFLDALFDTLLYQLGDGLSRVATVRLMSDAQESGQWSGLTAKERKEKEAFLAGEKRSSKGFLTEASLQLDLLQMMVCEEPAIARCLCVPPLAGRTAASFLGFLDTLCGPRASELKVKDMDKYAFHPRQLVAHISSVLLHVWRQDKQAGPPAPDSFTLSMAMHPDLSLPTLGKCVSVLQKQQLLDAAALADFSGFTQELERLQQREGGLAPQGAESPEGPGSRETDWQQEAESIRVDEAGILEAYVGALQESQYDCAELVRVHTLTDKATHTLNARSPKVRAILRDMKQLQESLPLHVDSAIFVRQDEERMDLARVLITGPVGTPYSRGCFIFDVYYPAAYPANPPIVLMTTTGGGTVRFNPNLYADGKVCLSLLGTWHGGDATEKWDPTRSSLYQVLLSIQGMILIPDPVFNEPGYETIRGTPQGDAQSRDYNADIQVHTIRYSMLQQLRSPPAGFEDTVRVHFLFQRDLILRQCSQWLRAATSPEEERRLRRAVDDLRAELERL